VKGINKDRKAGPFNSIGEARREVLKFLNEREDLKHKVKHGKYLWSDAVSEYLTWVKINSHLAGSTLNSRELTDSALVDPPLSNELTHLFRMS
jgi:hypothetical protein